MAVLRDGEVIEAGRVRLSRLTAAGVEAMGSWLAGALAPEWRIEDLERGVAAGDGVLISDSDGVAIGAAVVMPGEPADVSPVRAGPSRASGRAEVACIPFLGIEPARRFRGLGGEAGIALERHLRRELGCERVLAPVPDGRGLAVYFWLRLGFRPLTTSEAPWPLVGLSAAPMRGIWMLREGE